MTTFNTLDSDTALYCPRTLSAAAPQQLFKLCHELKKASEPIILDASDLTFIDPLGLATLRATLESIEEVVHIRFMPVYLIAYLKQMDFFKGLEVEGINFEERAPEGDPDNRVELIAIEEGTSEELATRLIQAMRGSNDNDAPCDSSEDILRPIEYALKELLENALSHAKRQGHSNCKAWVACQHFSSNDTVRLAIIDNGCGLLATLHDHAQVKDGTDMAAINAALLERVSCNRGPLVGYETDSQNQGIGLTTTARIAEKAEGALLIASGDALKSTDGKIAEVMYECNWQGVAIAFTCKRSKLHLVKIPDLLPETEPTADSEIRFF